MTATKQHNNEWTVVDWDHDLISTTSINELQNLIRSLSSLVQPPNTIVDIHAPNGDTLSVGIASPRTDDNPNLETPLACINFARADRNPPFLTVVGDRTLDFENGGVVIFRYEQGTWTEILRRNCVSIDTLSRIVADFFHHEALPGWIEWEEV